jgi:hypothetical protein
MWPKASRETVAAKPPRIISKKAEVLLQRVGDRVVAGIAFIIG